MKFSTKDFFRKCDQISNFLRIWSHLLKKSLMENFIFCAVKDLSAYLTHDVASVLLYITGILQYLKTCHKRAVPGKHMYNISVSTDSSSLKQQLVLASQKQQQQKDTLQSLQKQCWRYKTRSNIYDGTFL